MVEYKAVRRKNSRERFGLSAFLLRAISETPRSANFSPSLDKPAERFAPERFTCYKCNTEQRFEGECTSDSARNFSFVMEITASSLRGAMV